jgi:transposase
MAMFLKRMTRRVGRKRFTYWALVESYRTERGPRQRVVAHLGELRSAEQAGWAKLARRLDRKDRPEPSLFDPPPHPEPPEDEYRWVRLKHLRLERMRDFGDVWLAWGLWRLLGLDALLGRLMPEGKENIPWPAVAAILTIARFCEPSSELHIEDTWYRRTALDDLLGVESCKVHTDRLYEGLDKLLPHKDAIEKHLKGRLGELFDVKYDVLFYDMTSTYFEGLCAANEMAKRGYSRDSRPDCLQVCIGLIVTEDGMPLGYEVFDGNTNDSRTVQKMVEAVESKYGRANRVWVMDRGMVSEENLAYLRQRGGSYIVGTPKAMLRQFEQHMTDKGWQEVEAGVEVKLVVRPAEGADAGGTETFVLARSRDRAKKEQAMHERFAVRLEEGLRKLQAAAEAGRLTDTGLAHLRLGRLMAQNWRASSAYEVKIDPIGEPTGKARLHVTWRKNPRWTQWNQLSEGCYLLRTNLTQTDPAALWKQYIQLTDAEWAFRITKDELAIRPIWHQKKDRVKAHILVCFLAYVLWKTLGGWMERSGLGSAPRTLVEEFARIKSGDVVLPTRGAEDPARPGQFLLGKTLRLRCVVQPDEAQRVLLSRLGLNLPQRLRWMEEEPSPAATASVKM